VSEVYVQGTYVVYYQTVISLELDC
jgi:hypothetical protein